MNIEQLAREAGWSGIYSRWTSATTRELLTVPVEREQIERFAALVRAAALEEAAKVCDGKERRKWEIMFHGGSLEGIGPLDCAAAIRALAAQKG